MWGLLGGARFFGIVFLRKAREILLIVYLVLGRIGVMAVLKGIG